MSAALGVERSFAGLRWVLAETDREKVAAVSRAASISTLLAELLVARNVAPTEALNYLNPTLRSLLPEPLLLKDMEMAVERTHRAVVDGEAIAVFGDYDVDGSCSAALVGAFLSAIGRQPIVYIPDRMTEGYGPSGPALLRLHKEGAKLVITVDCGATADGPLAEARAAGLDTIVLDHHAVDHATSCAFAHVNPNQPGDSSGLTYLCAAGVTFLFLVALNRSLRHGGWYAANGIDEPDLRDFVDLAGLATVCDVVPLVGVNRAFVKSALNQIASRPRLGLKVLAAVARAEGPFTPHHFGFVFGPRINAGGRVGRCSLGAELLLATDEQQAEALARQLERHNRERQALEAGILEEAIVQASTQHNAPCLVVAEEGWHSGVVGIVAGRLKERFGKPAVAIGFENGMGRGSARSIVGVNIGAIVRSAKDCGILETGGGHAMAAGFSLHAEKLDDFRSFLATRTSEAEIGRASFLDLHGLFSPAGATSAMVRDVSHAGPFGAGNPEPILAAADLTVAFADLVGQGHVRLKLAGPDRSRLDAIAFRSAGTPLGDALLKGRGQRIHAAGTLKLDRWNGNERVQLHVLDAAVAT